VESEAQECHSPQGQGSHKDQLFLSTRQHLLHIKHVPTRTPCSMLLWVKTDELEAHLDVFWSLRSSGHLWGLRRPQHRASALDTLPFLLWPARVPRDGLHFLHIHVLPHGSTNSASQSGSGHLLFMLSLCRGHLAARVTIPSSFLIPRLKAGLLWPSWPHVTPSHPLRAPVTALRLLPGPGLPTLGLGSSPGAPTCPDLTLPFFP
jgi:hypothetical protein